MIASMRGLLVLLGIAMLLAIALVVGGSGQRGPIDRSLVPGFDPAKVTELAFSQPGAADVVLAKHGETWRWVSPEGVADPATVDGVLTALRGGHWHRKAAAHVAGATRGEVRVNAGGEVTTIGVARALEGGDQTWLVRGDGAYLVDDWVANALLPEPLALRMRQPLAAAGTAKAIVATGITATGEPLRLEGAQLVKPRTVWLDPAKLRALQDAMAALQIVELPPTSSKGSAAAVPDPVVISLEEPARSVAFAGACGKRRVLVHATEGDGCVEQTAWDALVAALRDLDQPVEKIADPRPLPFSPAKLVLADGTAVELAGRPRVGDGDADPDRVRELVVALTTRGVTIPRPERKPSGKIVATDAAGGTVTLELFDSGLVARAGEGAAIHVLEQPWQVLMRPSSALRDPVLWREDETTIQSIVVDGVTFTPGQLIGEWTRKPAGSVDAALVDALAQALASVRAPAIAKVTPRPTRRITVTFAPPGGTTATHALAIAPPTAEGCAADVDGAPVMLPLPLCTAAFAVSP